MFHSGWTYPLKLFWVDRVDVPIGPMSCWVERCVLRPQSNPPMCLVVWSSDMSRWGFFAPLIVWSIEQSCMVFGPGFPYKRGQLSSSNRNSGKVRLPPSVKKTGVGGFYCFYWSVQNKGTSYLCLFGQTGLCCSLRLSSPGHLTKIEILLPVILFTSGLVNPLHGRRWTSLKGRDFVVRYDWIIWIAQWKPMFIQRFRSLAPPVG
jgi:hypothetical protein